MFDTILGLPAHPLLIHAAVVLMPLLIAVVIGYAAVPRLRSRLDWAVVLLAIGAPAACTPPGSRADTYAPAWWRESVPAQTRADRQHLHYAGPLLTWAIVLGVPALVMVAVDEGQSAGEDQWPRSHRAGGRRDRDALSIPTGTT